MTDSTPAPKILVVDDEVKMCFTLTKLFELSKFPVEVAHNGLEALEKVESFKPNCILLDIRMPKMDGIEVLKKVKEEHPEIVVIMTTAVINEETRNECLNAGAADFLIKPINFQALIATIKNRVNPAVQS